MRRETRDRNVGSGSGGRSTELSAKGVGTVVDDEQAVPVCDAPNLVPVADAAHQVGNEDGPGRFTDRRLQLVQPGLVIVDPHVDEDRPATGMVDRGDIRGKSECRGENL